MTHEARGAWREPMLWLVVVLPAIVVVAAIVTLVLAIRSGGSDAVPVEVQRTAQIQVADLDADREALRLGLRGELLLDADTGAVQLALQTQAQAPFGGERLALQLTHPQSAAADLSIPLVRSGSQWLGRVPPDGAHAWNLALAPDDGTWRLVGRLPAGAARATLAPALAE